LQVFVLLIAFYQAKMCSIENAFADAEDIPCLVHTGKFHPSADGFFPRKVSYCFSLHTNFQTQEQAQ